MKKASFHRLDRATWPRSEHFDYYVTTIKSRCDITVHLDVSRLLPVLRARRIRRYPALLHIASRAVNRVRECRMGFDADGAPGYWDFVHPSYTIFHTDDKTFSDIWSEYDEAFPVFYASVIEDMERYRDIRRRLHQGRAASQRLPSLPFAVAALHGTGPRAGGPSALPLPAHHVRQAVPAGGKAAASPCRFRAPCGRGRLPHIPAGQRHAGPSQHS